MAEWLYENGIGERRAALVVDGEIVEAEIELDSAGPPVGTIASARLIEIVAPRGPGRVALAEGGEALLDTILPGMTEGRTLLVKIVREAIPERGRPKLPKAIPAPNDGAPARGPDLHARIAATGVPVRTLLAHEPDLLEAAGWSELLDEALTGEIAFPGGALRLFVTPAMTLFDVDGAPPLDRLALAAASAIARAITRHGIGGSIGIDFPTLSNRVARQAVGETLDAALAQPFERTAVNGFGFLQIVRRRSRASLPEVLASDPTDAKTRALLRRLERIPPPVPHTHRVPQRVFERLQARPGWMTELGRRTGSTPAFEAHRERTAHGEI